MESVLDPPHYRAYGRHDLHKIPQLERLSDDQMLALQSVAEVLPFRVNNYVIEQLIDWDDIPNDPIFQLTFPQVGMVQFDAFHSIRDLVAAGADRQEIRECARRIQMRMNPHPAGQVELNPPRIDGEPVRGLQHKYRETVLFFPVQGQTCHAFCSYCFRWPQFVGIDRLRLASDQGEILDSYLENHPEVTDLLITGGDPMVMRTKLLEKLIDPLLSERHEHLTSIRIGSKAPVYWPYRFLTDRDADDLLRLFDKVVASGRQLAFMAHVSHPRELQTAAAEQAFRRIQSTGATIRCQAPLIRHVNDDAGRWADLWRQQVRLGAVPYYMFVARNTGPRKYFEVPLGRALRIYSEAISQVSGLARTVRGPSMSANPGKVLVDGETMIGDERVFVLKMIQGRDPRWVNRVFFARFDSQAVWLDELEPALGEREFFFAPFMRAMEERGVEPEWKMASDDDQPGFFCEGA